MKGVSRERLLVAILICAGIVLFPIAIRSFSRVAVLIRAVKKGEMSKVKALLNAHPELVKAKDDRLGCTPLHWAVISDQADIAAFLLDKGADVNAIDQLGMTPLHKAAAFDRKDLADLLLSRDADPGIMGVKYRVIRVTPLHIAAEAGSHGVVSALISNGADVNIRTSGTNSVTSLHMAASRGHWDVVDLLLENGADVNARDSNDATPLHWAIVSDQEEIADLLRFYGGKE